MFLKFRAFAVVALAICAIALTASISSAAGMRWGGNVFGAFNTFSMKDWNSIIDQANASGSKFDNIKSGYSFGLGPFVVIDNKWQIGAHYEMLMAKKSEYQGVSVKPKANSFGASVDYLFPTQSKTSFSLGASGDYYSLSGELDQTVAPTTNKTKGTGAGGQVRGTGSYAFAPEFAGFVSAGYRFANIKIKDIGGQDVSASGLKTEDYSGLVLRVGISLMQSK
jgi:hypothetical protein